MKYHLSRQSAPAGIVLACWVMLVPSLLQANLVLNPGFEQGTGELPDHWETYSRFGMMTTFKWDDSVAIESSHSVKISVDPSTPEDAHWFQDLVLTPDTDYVLTGYIKAEHLNSSIDATWGVRILAHNGTAMSEYREDVGTYDWKFVALTFNSGPIGTVQLNLRIGGWPNKCTGTVWFDNIAVVALSPYDSAHFTLLVEDQDVDQAGISDEGIYRWLGHLDAAYVAYSNLVGQVPFDGRSVNIRSTRNINIWAGAGQTIVWNQTYVAGELRTIQDYDNWSFGILHEIGHTFDLDNRWNFDGEFFANFKMIYVADTRNSNIRINQTLYQGGDITNHYEGLHFGSINQSGTFHWRATMVRRFNIIKMRIGWDAFRSTFRYFNSLTDTDVPTEKCEKFNLFVERLGQYSGLNVWEMIPMDERAWLATRLGGDIGPGEETSIMEFARIGRVAVLTWNGTSGALYTVQSTSNLVDVAWNDLLVAHGVDGPVSVTNDLDGAVITIYRVTGERNAGTSSVDARSYPGIRSLVPEPTTSESTIRWPSVSNKLYSVQNSTNVSHGIGTLLEDRIPATPPENAYTDTADAAEGRHCGVEVGP